MSNPTLGYPYISAWKTVLSSDRTEFNATRFSIDCNIGYPKQTTDDGVRFDVTFFADGVPFGKFKANSTNPVVALDETYLRGHLGTKVCDVTLFRNLNKSNTEAG